MRPPCALLFMLLTACGGCDPEPGDSEPVDSPSDTDTLRDTGDTEPDTAPETVPAAVSDVSVVMNAEVATILELSWTQDAPAGQGWVEFRFEAEDWMSTPMQAFEAGDHTQVLLGIPSQTEVEIRVVNQGDTPSYSAVLTGTTGNLPGALSLPMLISYDPTIASAHPWVMGSVDVGNSWYRGPFYSFILDRQGRVVWYHAVSDSRLNLFTQVSADGTHILVDGSTHYVWDEDVLPSVDRMTLDKRYYEEIVIEDMGFSFDEIEGGNILYNAERQHALLVERYPDGSEREIFDCSVYAVEAGFNQGSCAINSVVHNPDQGTVFWSLYMVDTVIEVDYASGDVVRRFGQVAGGWAFDPPWSEVDYQHYPNYSPDGTVMASTHSRMHAGVQYAHEYVVDDDTQTMVATWSYGDEVMHYASYGGETFRLAGGNTFITYGTDGAIREVTPDKKTAWELEWPVAPDTHLVGHFSFIDDLYALNQGPADAVEAQP